MATIANLAVQLSMDSADFERGVGGALAQTESLVSKLSGVGRTMSLAVTAPMMAGAAAAIKFSTDLNAGMANTQSLGLAADRVQELKGNIQSMAVTVGKDTADLADGLYQVVSAFGDSADTAAILEINARAAAAGLATTTDAINLTSSVTKGFGDTSAEAVQHTSDLAFVAVKLGQTTFPELAASMGRVVPIAASLGVKQEELFGVMATATGVTGGAAEVSTQLRGVLQSLMAPTESMTQLLSSMGYETGAAMLQQEGLQASIEKIVAAAEASGAPLQSYIGSIEGQTLALALAGPQADVFTEKLAAMQDVAGASDAAFEAQTQGINASGFAMQQLTIKSQTLMQKVGDGLAPALAIVLEKITPLVDWVGNLATQFAGLDSNTQTMIVAAAGLVAALGPVLTMLPMIATAVGVIASPIGLVVVAVTALGAAWATNFGGIRDMTDQAWASLQPFLTSLSAQLAPSLAKLQEALAGLPEAFGGLAPKLAELGTALRPLITMLGTGLAAAAQAGVTVLSAAFTRLPEIIGPLIDQMITTIEMIATTITGVATAVTAVAEGDWQGAFTAMQGVVEGFITYFEKSWTNFKGMLSGVGNFAMDILPPEWVATITSWSWPEFPDLPSLWNTLLSWKWPSFPSLPSILTTLVNWKWPSFPSMPGWLDDLLSWSWPSPPDILGGATNALGGAGNWLQEQVGGIVGGGSVGEKAKGTPYWKGGLTWVGEAGPELINLPRGTNVYPNDLSMEMAGGAGAGGGVQITVNATVANELDIRQLAYQLATEFERWRR